MSKKSDSEFGAEIGKILQVVVSVVITGLTGFFAKKKYDQNKNKSS